MILMTSEVIRKMNRMSQECIKGGGESLVPSQMSGGSLFSPLLASFSRLILNKK